MTQPVYLSYADIRARQRTHTLRQTEVPVEHTVSLPLPTLRWVRPAYACFASPAIRRPGQPAEQDPPDRWWAVDARTGHLVAYALWSAVPFATGVAWGRVSLPTPAGGIAALQSLMQTVELLMESLAPDFFDGQPGDPQARRALAEALDAVITEPLRPQVQALAPDFSAWLQA
jgi:hypothetical protein